MWYLVLNNLFQIPDNWSGAAIANSYNRIIKSIAAIITLLVYGMYAAIYWF
jgi:hypothetical protein